MHCVPRISHFLLQNPLYAFRLTAAQEAFLKACDCCHKCGSEQHMTIQTVLIGTKEHLCSLADLIRKP